jgi:Nuclease-related domain
VNLDDLAHSISAVSNHTVIQHLSQLLRGWKLDGRTILYILLALAVGFVIGRYRASRTTSRAASFQNRGEALLSRAALTNFGPPDYHLMNHVTLQMNDGTTQVDHILVSRFGVFVIETKDYKGWIFANANQANWTQVLFKWKFKFQNPIFQNLRHVRAVQDLLDFLPPGAIKSVVVFTGKAEFMTEIPQGVFGISGLIDYLREQTVEVMSLNRVQFCVGRLETARLAISGETDVEHVQGLERRHGSAA